MLWLLGEPLLESALATRRRDAATADLLIVVGVAAAYVYSAISVVRGAGHVYFEVGCAVLVMVTIGRWLEATGKAADHGRARRSAEAPAAARARGGRQWGAADDVAIGDVTRGDRLRVLAGERIATDGHVERGLRERLRATTDRRKPAGHQAAGRRRSWAAA